jgi:hypothetical protein
LKLGVSNHGQYILRHNEKPHLTDNSASAWSNSSLPAFLSRALAFFAAFFSFLTTGGVRGGSEITGVWARTAAAGSVAFFFFF